jgi:Na+/H+ antiporter NhaD/arsenite permease-like protein
MTIIVAIIFIVGYLAIAFEQSIKINKAASALLAGVICWAVYSLSGAGELVSENLSHHLSEIAGILFFLLGAMVIVELIDAHDGFEIITERIQSTNKKKLVWIIGFITFFLSAILDNLTTTIVMVSLLRKLIPSHKERLIFAGLVVIAANAGGAWSPIGDVTTTMLWIGHQITTVNIIIKTFLPALICFVVPAFVISMQMKGSLDQSALKKEKLLSTGHERKTVFIIGIACLLFVPVFKTITHLPPYMGIIFGLGLMWLLTEMVHSGKDEAEKGLLSVNHALRKIDTPSILFFLGILLAVSALQSTGILTSLAGSLDRSIGNISIITIIIGFLSAIVDNVPLVAAAQGMYSLDQYPTDHFFWEFLAYCSGTGGSILIIGSAAGVAAMGMEKIQFGWYLKKIAWLAILGYLAGAGVFLLQHYLLNL